MTMDSSPPPAGIRHQYLTATAERYMKMAWRVPDLASSELFATIAEDFEVLAAEAVPEAIVSPSVGVAGPTPRRSLTTAMTAWLRDPLPEKSETHSFSLMRLFF
jgi:hypothetical protein